MQLWAELLLSCQNVVQYPTRGSAFLPWGPSHPSLTPLRTVTAPAYPKSCAHALRRFHCRSGRVSSWLMPLLGVSKSISLSPWQREHQRISVFNFSPCGSPGSTVTAYPRPVPARGWPRPCPLRGLLCVPGGCTVRACSPGHAHSAHHLCVPSTAPRAPGVCAACRVSSSASCPSRPALHIVTVSASHPLLGLLCTCSR